jgi:hypothetical protein
LVYKYIIVIHASFRASHHRQFCKAFLPLAFFGKGYARLSFAASVISSVKTVCIYLFDLFLKVICAISDVHKFLDDLLLAIVLIG